MVAGDLAAGGTCTKHMSADCAGIDSFYRHLSFSDWQDICSISMSTKAHVLSTECCRRAVQNPYLEGCSWRALPFYSRWCARAVVQNT